MRREKDDALRIAVGRVLADVRVSRELTQTDIDVVDQSSLSKIEGGVNFPSWPTLLELCRRYRVEPDEILTAARALLTAKEGASVVPVEGDARTLLDLFNGCTAEGKRLMLDRAKAVKTLFPK